MSVAELKAQANSLSFEELSELSRHIRALALCKDPNRKQQLIAAETSQQWLTREEFESALSKLDRRLREIHLRH